LVVLLVAAGIDLHGWGPTSATASTTIKSTGAKSTGAKSKTTATKLSLKIRPRVVHETATSGVTATLSLHDAKVSAGQTVAVTSEQLQQECPTGVTYTWGTVSHADDIDVVLDKAGNATVTVTSTECAPGALTVLANFLDPPYDSASGTLKVFTVKPPAHMSIAVTPNPVQEAAGVPIDETVNVVSSDALQSVIISSPDLVSECTTVIFKNADGASSANTITVPVNIDYQATVTLTASNCQAGSDQIRADSLEVPYPTASTSLQVVAPTS
jgi:hypothetical protein